MAINREEERRPKHAGRSAAPEGRNGLAARGEHGGEEAMGGRCHKGQKRARRVEKGGLPDCQRGGSPLMDPNYNFGIMPGTMRTAVAGTGPFTARVRDEQNAVSSEEGGHQAGLWTSWPKLGSRSKKKVSLAKAIVVYSLVQHGN